MAPLYVYSQSCDCPPVTQCGACQGGITSLTLRYDGLLGLGATITADDDGPGVLFSGWVDSGSTFTITGSNPDDTFNGDEVNLTGLLIDATINTSCGTPVYVNSVYGNFTVVAGESKDGGPVCCAPADMETTPPVISNCPADIQLAVAPSGCSTIASWTAPTATDNCGSVILTSTHNPGDTFAKGSTPVVYTATDDYGNISTCSFNVIVDDDTDPVIAGWPVSDIIVNADTSCEAIVSWTAPTASDNCGPVTLASPNNPGDVFPLGTTAVTYTATDDSGNTATCVFNVIVNDNTNPTIAGCPASDIVVSANASCEATVSWPVPAASDNCGPVTLTSSKSPGDVFLVGTTLVTYTATDGAGNASTCTFNVIVNDDTGPVITGCPAADIIVNTDASCQATVSWTPPTVSDNCGPVTLTSSKNPGDVFSLGATIVTYTATDEQGNTATCTFRVIVNDETDPVITGCPGTDIVAVANADCQANVSWIVPVASDNCGTVNFNSSNNPGDVFFIGTTVVTYTATDAAGNISTCTFNVIVSDNTDPVIMGCPSDIIVSANGACEAVVNWTAPTSSDNCGSAALTANHNPGETFALGTTVVTYTAMDDDGNISTCSFNVVVNDDTDPVISGCIASDIVVTVNGACQGTATWVRPTATDNCGAATLNASHNPGNFPVGTTLVTYTATDGFGNTSTCSFNVIVQDVTNPVVSGCVSSDIIVSANSLCQATASWAPPAATDNCGSVTMTSSHDPGDLFDLGTTVVTYTATDGYGNTATCSFNVIVKDETSPMLSGCSDVIVTASGSCETSVTWTPPKVDDCQPVTLIGSHSPGDLFSLGTTEVTYTATDSNGNTSSCNFNVIVEDKTSPVFQNCPEEIVMLVDNGCDAIVTWVEPTATDNCEGVTLTKSHAPGDTFSTGTTAVTYTATDAHGNVSVCQFNVTVSIVMSPIITNCPVDVNVNGNERDEASVNWTSPTGTSACSEVVLTSTHQPGDIFSLGTTLVEYKFEDTYGNVSYCRFNVVVTRQEIDIDISKVVTPDGNGVNDEWIVTNIEKFHDNKVVIVDRWGGVIYTASGYNNVNVVWKGVNRNGGSVPTGTYFYIISVRYGPSVFEKSGFIELIR